MPVKMLATRARTERPHGALLQPGAGVRRCLYRIGGRQRSAGASLHGAAVGIPPLQRWAPNRPPLPAAGQCQAGSLTGAVASEKVSEAPKGPLMMDGNHQESAKAEGGPTATPTGGAGTKVGLSDPAAWKWDCRRSTDKSYPGDNRLITPKSPHRRSGLAPRCRLIASWGCSRSQGLGCSPIKAVRELGSERRETVRSLSGAGAGLLRGAGPSTRGPGRTGRRCTCWGASPTAG